MRNSTKVILLSVLISVATFFNQVYAGINSVNCGPNARVYYGRGATQEEAQKLADYFRALEVADADIRVGREGADSVLTLKVVAAPGASVNFFKTLSAELENDVFKENVVVKVCDETLHEIYRVGDRSRSKSDPEVDAVLEALNEGRKPNVEDLTADTGF